MPIQLHYQHFGNSKGDTLLFLHGLFGSGRNLYTLAKQFSDDYQIFLLDLRNHGQSPHHEEMDYPGMNEDIISFIKQKEIDQPILIGHSMGGKISMVNALNDPETVRAIVVLDIAPVDYEINYIQLIDILLSLKLEQFRSRTDADHELKKTYDNQIFRHFLLQNLIRIEDQFQWRLNLQTIRNEIELIKSFPSLAGKTFERPSFFLSGEDSDYVLPEHEKIIMNFFPAATMASIPEAGHWLQADQPQKVANGIREFLNSLSC